MIDLYDFDKTIYDGDSTIDFYLYCLRKKPALLKYLPYQLWHGILFVLRIEKKTIFKGNFFIFLRGIDNLERYVEGFWMANERKIKPWYTQRDHGSDVIISASPEFLLKPITKKLKALKIIATRVDTKTGRIDGKNCHGDEKVVRLRREITDPRVAETYTDSLSDMPILQLADRKYMVNRHKIMTLEDYGKLPFIQRLFWR